MINLINLNQNPSLVYFVFLVLEQKTLRISSQFMRWANLEGMSLNARKKPIKVLEIPYIHDIYILI